MVLSKQKRKTIVFIICHGKSGSTVFSKFLGNNTNCFALSELHYFDTQHLNNEICSCEKSYMECNFWKNIRLKLGIDDSELEKFHTSRYGFNSGRGLNKIINYLSLFSYVKFNIPFVNRKYFNQLLNQERLLCEIASERDEEVLIDASKSLVRAIILRKLLHEKFNFKFVLLKRDPRSVISSQKKNSVVVKLNSETKVLEKNREAFDIKKQVLTLRRSERTNLILFKVFNIQKYVLTYEEFATNPTQSFKDLSKFIGQLDWEDDMLNLEHKAQHLLGGNYSRINAKKIKAPRLEWSLLTKHEMDKINQVYKPI